MNNEKIQLYEPSINIGYIKKIINILNELNSIEDYDEINDYDIILDYHKNQKKKTSNFRVLVTVDCDGIDENISKFRLFNFNFKFDNEQNGFQMFKLIINSFMDNSNVMYKGFETNNDYTKDIKYSNYHVITDNNVNLYSIIRSKDYENELIELHNMKNIKQNYTLKKIPQTSDRNVQIFKAYKKMNIVKTIIGILHDLSTNDTERKANYYKLELGYLKEKINDCYNFIIKITRNESVIPFSLNFKLDNIENGIKILNDISIYFVNENKCDIGYFHSPDENTICYECVSFNNQGIIKLAYNIPKEDSKDIVFVLSDEINKQKENEKTKQKQLKI